MNKKLEPFELAMRLEETFDFTFEISDFAAACELNITRPHLIDKRLSGCVIESKFFSSKTVNEIIEQFQSNESVNEIKNKENVTYEILIPKSNSDQNVVIIRNLLLKKKDKTSHDIVIWNWIDPDIAEVHVVPERDSAQKYSLKVTKKSNQLQLFCNPKAPKTWLKHILVKKVLKWSSEKLSDQALSGSSLKLISIDEYVKLYNELKDKYFDCIAQAWDSESTNAEKFIHEDLGIAAYLLLIWKKYDYPQSQSKGFVDLGCGNGLLVHLLTQEGIPGVGLDIRKRKIWNFFREKGTDLR